MIKLKDLLKEDVEYYIDKTKDDLEKYVAKDGGDLYVGRRGMKVSTNFLKFTLAPAKYKSVFNIRLKKNKLQQISKRQLQKDIDRGGVLSYVDFKKLYKR